MGAEIGNRFLKREREGVGTIDLSPLFEQIHTEAREPFRRLLQRKIADEFTRAACGSHVTEHVDVLVSDSGLVHFILEPDNKEADEAGATADTRPHNQIAAVQHAINTLFAFGSRNRFSTGMQPYNPYPQLEAAEKENEHDALKEHPNPKIWHIGRRKQLQEAAERRRRDFVQRKRDQLEHQLNTEEAQRWEAVKARFVREYVLTKEPEFNITAQRIAIILEDKPEKKEQQQLRAASRIILPVSTLQEGKLCKIAVDNFETGDALHVYILMCDADNNITLYLQDRDRNVTKVLTLHSVSETSLQPTIDINGLSVRVGHHTTQAGSALHGIGIVPQENHIMITTQSDALSSIVDWTETDD